MRQISAAALRSLVGRQLARHRRAALLSALALRHLGWDSASARVAKRADVIGSRVPILVPGSLWPKRLVLHSCEGRDLVARELWFGGWSGFERPLPGVLAVLARRLSGTFLDVGANTGFYGLLASRVNPRLRVYCFEPFPPVFELLARNLALNGSPPRVTAVPLAVGSSIGTAKLYVPLQGHGLVESSCSLDPSFKEVHSEVVTVDVTTVDAFVAREGISDLSLVKIDVEGFEPAVLEGAAGTVARERPVLVYELLRQGNAPGLERFRATHGYVSFKLAPQAIVREVQPEFDPSAWNHLMMPEERLGLLRQVAAEAGCAYTDTCDDRSPSRDVEKIA